LAWLESIPSPNRDELDRRLFQAKDVNQYSAIELVKNPVYSAALATGQQVDPNFCRSAVSCHTVYQISWWLAAFSTRCKPDVCDSGTSATKPMPQRGFEISLDNS
jgi:hypothetical protein